MDVAKPAVALLCLAGATACNTPAPPVEAAQTPVLRPNIVYIVADDQGWKDVGFHGSDIRTPNIDALAEGGARFDQFYTQPFCTPSRAALLTGRYPHRYGLQTLVIPSAGTYGLPTDEWLLPQALQQAGYFTAIVGKWHLGHADRKYWPLQRGFDEQYGPLLGEIDYFTHSAHGTRDWFRDEQPVTEEGYVTALLGDEAVRLIERSDSTKPFFIYLAFTAPHAPYQVPPPALEEYAQVQDPTRRAYDAMITAMDTEIGRVIRALDARGLRDRTLIVFQSDNGGPRSAKVTGEVSTEGMTIPADNGPYREGKGTLYEGGTRVIALMNWPGQIPSGAVVDGPVHIVDMYPTLAALAGAHPDSAKPLDGIDIWSSIAEGRPSPRTEVVYEIEPFRAGLRQGDWKLVWRVTLPSNVELFNLAEDPGEQNNLAEREPGRVATLQQRVEVLSREAVPPLLLQQALPDLKALLFGSVTFPEEEIGRGP